MAEHTAHDSVLNRAIEHIGIAFPHWEEEHRREYALKAYEHLFTLAVETAVMPRVLSEDGWPSHVRLGNMADAVRELVGAWSGSRGGSKRPCVLITGHTGHWELLGYSMALLGFPMHALYRPLELKQLKEWLAAAERAPGHVRDPVQLNLLSQLLTSPTLERLARDARDERALTERYAELAEALDDYIRERLFGEDFEPFTDEGWRLLLLQPVIEHVVKVFGLALVHAEERATIGETEVRHRRLSEVPRLMMRESTSAGPPAA